MKLGTNDISSVKLGANTVNAVYLGSNLVWQNAPVATAATGIGQTSFTANWNAYTGATYYLLDVSTSSSFTTFVYENQITTSTSYVVIGLESNTTYYYRIRASTEYDSDAQAFFDRVATAGGALSTTEKAAVDILVGQMKTDGIWTKMKAIYPMVGASAAACAQNLKSSSFTGTFTATGWTFASTGVTPNGTSAYMDTGLLPSASLTNNNTHLSFYSRTNSVPSSGEMVEIGAYEAPTADLFEIQLRHSNDNFITSAYNFTTFRLSSSNTNSQGFFIGNRSSSTSLKNFKNGTLLGTNSATNTTNITSNNTDTMYLSAINPGTNPVGSFSNRECAFASIGDGLTDTEASNFYTEVQAFQTTLSRQV